MNNKTTTKGVLSVAAVALLLAVCMSPIFIDETDAAGDGTIYLLPGDTATWTPDFTIAKDRISLTVGISSSSTATPTYSSSTSAVNGVTATVNSDKTVTIAVGSSATHGSVAYVKVKATTTSGVSQEKIATITVKVIKPTITQNDVNTYVGGKVEFTPTISNASIDGATSTYTATGLPSGLDINKTTGKITGTVSTSAEAKSYSVKVIGTTGTTPTRTFSDSFNIVVAASMSLAAHGTEYTAQGTEKTITLSGTNIPSNATWKITSGSATGISMSSATGTTGTITVAKTTAAGEYTVNYSVTNPTSKQTVSTGSVKIVVGSVGISKITSEGGVADAISNGKVNLWAVAGSVATFTVTPTSNVSLGTTLSVSGTDASKVTYDGQTITVPSTLAADTYTFTITETQASTGAKASVTVTLTVDKVLDFTNSVTDGSLTVKGA